MLYVVYRSTLESSDTKLNQLQAVNRTKEPTEMPFRIPRDEIYQLELNCKAGAARVANGIDASHPVFRKYLRRNITMNAVPEQSLKWKAFEGLLKVPSSR